MPPQLAGETLVVKIGILGPGWLQWYKQYHWNDAAAAFTVDVRDRSLPHHHHDRTARVVHDEHDDAAEPRARTCGL